MTATTTSPQVCTRCIMDETVSGITFDDQGVCNHCHIHDTLDNPSPLTDECHQELLSILQPITRDRRVRPYDCTLCISDRRYTRYCLYMTKQLGLRPLAVPFDHRWDPHTPTGSRDTHTTPPRGASSEEGTTKKPQHQPSAGTRGAKTVGPRGASGKAIPGSRAKARNTSNVTCGNPTQGYRGGGNRGR